MAKAKTTREAQLEGALKDLLASCGCVPISALKGETVKDFRKVLAFMAACDAAKELVGDERDMSDEIDDDETEAIATYDMSEDAMGLGDFITTTFKDIPDSLIVVDVCDEQQRPAKSARFERDDFGIHLIIEFDRTIFG